MTTKKVSESRVIQTHLILPGDTNLIIHYMVEI